MSYETVMFWRTLFVVASLSTALVVQAERNQHRHAAPATKAQQQASVASR